jgi:hypothetical protein
LGRIFHVVAEAATKVEALKQLRRLDGRFRFAA